MRAVKRGATITVVISVAVIAFMLLAPIIPFRVMIRHPAMLPITSIICSPNPSGVIRSLAPGVLYEGYESISHHFIGVGFIVYASCYYGY